MSLRRYARDMLRDDRLRLAPQFALIRNAPGWSEIVLHRAAPYQTVLVVLRPGVDVPMHRHMRCDSIDVALVGSGATIIGDIRAGFGAGRRGPLAANLVPIRRGQAHGGESHVLGAVFLSFQHWLGDVGFATDDWTPA